MFNSHKSLEPLAARYILCKIDTELTSVQWSLFSEERSLLRHTVGSFSGNGLLAGPGPGKS